MTFGSISTLSEITKAKAKLQQKFFLKGTWRRRNGLFIKEGLDLDSSVCLQQMAFDARFLKKLQERNPSY